MSVLNSVPMTSPSLLILLEVTFGQVPFTRLIGVNWASFPQTQEKQASSSYFWASLDSPGPLEVSTLIHFPPWELWVPPSTQFWWDRSKEVEPSLISDDPSNQIKTQVSTTRACIIFPWVQTEPKLDVHVFLRIHVNSRERCVPERKLTWEIRAHVTPAWFAPALHSLLLWGNKALWFLWIRIPLEIMFHSVLTSGSDGSWVSEQKEEERDEWHLLDGRSVSVMK